MMLNSDSTPLLSFSQPAFPRWAKRPLAEIVPGLCPAGLDLLEVCLWSMLRDPKSAIPISPPPKSYASPSPPQQTLRYEPGKRISAKAALSHPYFDDLDKSVF